MNNYLIHYGIKGQQWGIRRYQNEDGTLTEEGKRRYGADSYDTMSNKAKNRYLKDYKKSVNQERTHRMIAERNEYQDAESNTAKKVAKGLLIGFKEETARSVYDVARASGEGRAKSFLRSCFDISASRLASSIAVSAGKNIANRLGHQKLSMVLGATGHVIGRAGDYFISKKMHESGHATSLQERALRKKYYSNEN